MVKAVAVSHRGIWLAAGIVAAAAVAIVWSTRNKPDPGAPVDATARQAEAAAAPMIDANSPAAQQAAAGAVTVRVDPRTVPPLPALDTPLRQSIEGLRERAVQGDALAACRIAAEYEWCEHRRQRRAISARRLESLRNLAPRPSANAEAVTRRLEQAAKVAEESDRDYRAHCEGAPVLGASQRANYWRQAALQGHLPSMRHYANGNAFRFDDMLDALPELARYRTEAESMALRAANAGDMAMTYALAMGYVAGAEGGRRSFLAQAVQPDEARALVLFRRLSQSPRFAGLPPRHPFKRAVAVNVPGLEGIADRAALAEATQAMGAYSAESGASMPQLFENGGIGDTGREACDARDFVRVGEG